MPRHFFLYAALLAASLVASPAVLRAQQSGAGTPPANLAPSAHVNGIGIPTVAGLPFSATVVIEVERPMRDGSVRITRTINRIARDSSGRTHNEVRRLMPESFHGSPQLMEVRLFDPLTRMSTVYYPATHLARQQVLPVKPKTANPPNPWLQVEDLGTTTLDGLEAKGTRRTLNVSPFSTDPGEAVMVVDEIWFAKDLRINLLVHHIDPRSGEQMAALSGIQREEPPAAMFEVPQGYSIVDAIPPAAPKPLKDPMEDELP